MRAIELKTTQLFSLPFILLSLLGSLLFAVSSQLAIPLQPVPITLQTMVVVMYAMFVGPKIGVASVALYLIEGALGMPVFAECKGGMAHLFGMRGGYLFGFIPAAFLAGSVYKYQLQKHLVLLGIVTALSLGIILFCGSTILANYIGWETAIAFGVKPFLFGDMLKWTFIMISIPTGYKAFGDWIKKIG